MPFDLIKSFPLTKVSEENGRHVAYGVVTAQVPDKDGEICIYADTKPHYQSWADASIRATKAAGQEESLGNIRLQHGMEIGGKATRLDFDDATKTTYLETEPVSDHVWGMLKRGILKGYSHGGKYLYRRCAECNTDIAEKGSRHCPNCNKQVYVNYAAEIYEVSYVDSPCLGHATFQFVKSDGSSEVRKFDANSKIEAEPAKPQTQPQPQVQNVFVLNPDLCAKFLAGLAVTPVAKADSLRDYEVFGALAKYSPDQPRDDSGRWAAATTAAIRTSNRPRYSHEQAISALNTAVGAHEQAAQAHESKGNTRRAKFHRSQAALLRTRAEAHAQSIEAGKISAQAAQSKSPVDHNRAGLAHQQAAVAHDRANNLRRAGEERAIAGDHDPKWKRRLGTAIMAVGAIRALNAAVPTRMKQEAANAGARAAGNAWRAARGATAGAWSDHKAKAGARARRGVSFPRQLPAGSAIAGLLSSGK